MQSNSWCTSYAGLGYRDVSFTLNNQEATPWYCSHNYDCVCGQAKTETENCLETQCPTMILIAELRPAVFHLEHFNLLLLGLMTSPSSVQVYHSHQRMRWRQLRNVCVCVCVKNKRLFEVKKSSLGLEFIRYWGDSGRNKSKEWELFFLLRYATTWALSLPAVF